MLSKQTKIRNVAIIAHVDHGKTTLVDELLKQAQVFRTNQQIVERVMDSNDLERERGITILAKNTAISIYDPETEQQVKINIVDTPGHADFGGEVERILNMVDGVLLLIDAAEGPMPQTRFVLKKALEFGHYVIVVINKIDHKNADPERALNETFDLFIELGATDEQADFAVVYTIALTGKAGLTPEVGTDLQPLFNTILQEIPCPEVDVDAPLQMLVTTLDYDTYRGLTAIGRIFAGRMTVGDQVTRITRSSETLTENIRYLYTHEGMQRVEVEMAEAGEIVAIAGLDGIAIGETLADLENPVALPLIEVEEPTIRMTFGVNSSPFSGQEGRWGSSRKLRERLFNELKRNISLRVEETDSADKFIVSGRGELHLAILIETMRREGYEFQVSRPEVIFHKDSNGKMLEPYEEVYIETSQDTVGTVIGMLGKRRGEMRNMENGTTGTAFLTYRAPTRGLLGFRYQFMTATRGLGTMHTIADDYDVMAGEIEFRPKGSLVASEAGAVNSFGISNAEQRGALFVDAGIKVYQGMIVGEHQRPGDLDVNICKKKQLTNMRNAVRDIEKRLTPPRNMSLDECIEYLADDELLEVTPDNLRLRKSILNIKQRGRKNKQVSERMSESS